MLIHNLVTTWKYTGNSAGDIDGLKKDCIIYVPDW